MRAVFLPGYTFDHGEVIEITGERFHHLVNVTRLRSGSNVLLLRGDGIKAWAGVVQLKKRSLLLEIYDVQKEKDLRFLDLVVGIPKKEAFDEVLRVAAECGIRRVYPFECEYAQKLEFNKKRQQRVIESGVIQSNNPFSVQVRSSLKKLEEVLSLSKEYQQTFLATLKKPASQEWGKTAVERVTMKGALLIVGPEGGFSSIEEEELCKFTETIRLPSYILRTPHAVSSCFGWIASKEIEALR